MRHIPRRRLLKAALFHPQAPGQAGVEFPPVPDPPRVPDLPPRSDAATGAEYERPAGPRALRAQGSSPADDRPATVGAELSGGALPDRDARPLPAGVAIPRQPGPLYESTERRDHHDRGHDPRYTPTAADSPGSLYRAVTGEIIDASPQVVVIGGAGERRFALTADVKAWRGVPLEPEALRRGDVATIRLLPNRPGVADRIWANVGRVTGTIVGREGDRLLVADSRAKPPRALVIPDHARARVQVRYPNLECGYLIDVIGLRHRDYLEGLRPASPQPTYRSDRVRKDRLPPGRTPETIAGSATWHDFDDEPYGILGVSYPAIDPAASCREDFLADYPPGAAPAFRDLPYLAVGTALTVRNECTGISCTLPVTGCAPMARLFNDRCVACANSPRGRVAELTISSFVALGGELEEGCFSTTLTIGR